MGEAAVVAQVRKHTGLRKAIQEHVRLARARCGIYNPLTFMVIRLAPLSAVNAPSTADDTRLLPLADPFMALVGLIVHPSRFLAARGHATVEALRSLLLADLVARTPLGSPGG